MSQLEQSLALTRQGAGAFLGMADPRYEANSGMFGGWTAALLVKAVLSDERANGTCSFLSVQYLRMIAPGSALHVSARPLGGSNSVTTWRVEVMAEGGEFPSASGTVLLTSRRPGDTWTEPTMPRAAAPEDLPPFAPPGAFGQSTENRLTRGNPPFGAPDTVSHGWVREVSGRPMDAVQLAYLSDCYAPRVFHISKGPRPSSTLTLSLTILAGAEELAAVGDDWILTEATATRIEQSQAGSTARHWSRDGKLLATSEQLCWFR